jgi:hypothetical protein
LASPSLPKPNQCTREALYRTLASLERAGAIERAGTRILLKKSVGPR